MSRVLTIVLAGGKGERLQPLTDQRAKPAVPFGGIYRIIDFTLSNCIHSGLRQIMVLTQYKSQSLSRHLRRVWGGFNRDWGEFLEIVPPQQRVDERWYEGTADAVFQNIYAIEQTSAEDIVILSGDHIYMMDYRQLLADHQRSGAEATIACVPVPLSEGSSFGVMGTDEDQTIVEFQEKPSQPFPLPNDANRCLASMGVYVFRAEYLLEQLTMGTGDSLENRDFGRHILPRIIERQQARAYPFEESATGGPAYWRDVGTIDAYYESSRDMLRVEPPFTLRDPSWRVHTSIQATVPAFVDLSDGKFGRVDASIIGPGTLVTDARVSGSILSAEVIVERDAQVLDSILFDGVVVGRGVTLQRTIVDKHVTIPAGTVIGVDVREDMRRGFHVSESGVVVVPKGFRFSRSREEPWERTSVSAPLG